MSARGSRTAAALLLLTAAGVGVVAAVSIANPYVLAGLGDPGWIVDAGLPAARVIALGSATVIVGRLLLAVVLAPGDPRGSVSPAGFAALSRAARWAWLYAAAAAVAMVLSIAENTGRPVGELLAQPNEILAGATAADPPAGWAVTVVLAAALGIGARAALSWRAAAALLVVAVLTPGAVALTGDLGVTRSHDIAIGAALLHTVGAVLWAGSALAVISALRRGGDVAAAAARRHDAAATAGLVLVGLSGLLAAALAVPAADLLRTGYGLVVLGSALALLALVVLARTVRARLAQRRGAGRLVVAELGMMLLAGGAGTLLTRQVPPVERTYTSTRSQDLVGFDLPGQLTATDLLTRWRWDVVIGTLAVTLALAYLVGVRRARSRGAAHPPLRTVSWLAGCTVLLLASSSGLGTYGRAVFSVHLLDMVLLGAVAPVLLVLGHGVSLLLSASGEDNRGRWEALLDAPPVRTLRHPVAAWCSVAALLVLLYPTGLFDSWVQDHWAHPVLSLATFGTGLLLFWSLLGRSPGVDVPVIGRVVLVFATMSLHAGFHVWLLSTATPLAAGWYSSFDLPYTADLLADQHRGAVLSWALGELPVMLAVIALVLAWSRDDDPPAPVPAPTPHRPQRQAELTGAPG